MQKWTDTSVAMAYLLAKKDVLGSKFAHEVVERPGRLDGITESDFLRELAWVILSGGMSESVVRRVFPAITESFFKWRSAEEIAERFSECVGSATAHFGHCGKIEAIAEGARIVHRRSFDKIRREIAREPLPSLMAFPFIGPVTAYHLAKNIGFRVAKPDRHLVRLASATGFSDVQTFCGHISAFLGEDIRKVDYTLWRFATMYPDYLTRFARFTA